MRVFLRTKQAFNSSDAKAFAFILGPQPVGNAWVVRDLSEQAIEVLIDSRRFDVQLDDPRPEALRNGDRRIVKLIEPNLAKRKLVLLRSAAR